MLRRLIVTQLLLTVLSGCATTGATYRSGVGDRLLARPPWYAGATTTIVTPDLRIGVHPIVFQVRPGSGGIFDPSRAPGSPIAELLREMNAYLDSLSAPNGMPVIRLTSDQVGVAPDVRFGCLTEGNLPGEDCVTRGDSALGRGDQRMQLSVGRPSTDWIAASSAVMERNSVEHALVITLEVGDYLMRQTGITGKKSVELGTDHTVAVPWLTSLETPVQVLQLTGAVVDRTGRAIRIGAEGIMARRTRLLVSALGAQELLSDEDVTAVRGTRRSELAGEPLAWRVALRNLVVGLTK
jgi:hypothetical protein